MLPKQNDGTNLKIQDSTNPKFLVDSIILKTKMIKGNNDPIKKFKKKVAI